VYFYFFISIFYTFKQPLIGCLVTDHDRPS